MIWWQSLVMLFGMLTVAAAGGAAGRLRLPGHQPGRRAGLPGRRAGLMQVVRNGVASITNFSLTPIPFFVLMGEVLFHTGLAMRAIDSFDRAIRGVPARLSVVAIVAGTVFSAISGSTIATTALLGSLLLPQMLKRGYHPRLAMGPIMAIGGVDMLIPPSALTVLLGSLAGISISGLLIAGVVPGFVMATMFLGWIMFAAWRRPEAGAAFRPRASRRLGALGPAADQRHAAGGDLRDGHRGHVGRLGHAHRVGRAGCAGHRHRLPGLPLADRRGAGQGAEGTAAISGVILFIIIGATTFSQILSFSGATNGLVGMVKDGSLAPWMVLGVMIADAAGAGLLRRPGQHDADHAAVLHAAGAALRLGPAVVRRCVPDLHATGPADAALRHAAVHHAQRGAEGDPDARDLRRRHALRADGHGLMIVLVLLFPGLATWLPSVLLGK
jgi:hypothetical protein